MAAIDDLRDDMHRVEDTVGDLRDRVSKHEGQDEARHVAQMAGQAEIKGEVVRLGDAVRGLTAKLDAPGGLPKDEPTPASDGTALTARVRFPAPPSLVTAGRWGLVLLAFAGPTALTVAGAVYAVPPAQVQAAIKVVEQASTVLLEPAPAPATPTPAGPVPQPTEPQE